ncbi:MAG: MBL fold metallo-hydrolase, partial [Bryocella sp.]
GVGKRLRNFGVDSTRITELNWTDSTTTTAADGSSQLKITSVPARHFSGRGLFDRFSTLWASFILEGPQHRLFFGADSGQWEGFAEVGQTHGPFDLILLEIGAGNPLWREIHLGPDGAVEAWKALTASPSSPARANRLMPIHWGLFSLALHGWRDPIETLTARAELESIPLFSPRPGQPAEITPTTSLPDSSWR